VHCRQGRHLGVGGIDRQVEELLASFLLDVKPVGDPLEVGAPRSDELAVAVEHHHRVGAVARRVHGVMDVDVPLRILDHTVRVAPLDPRRQLAPVVNRLVGVGAGAEHRRAGA
jgi:hypothetical protein